MSMKSKHYSAHKPEGRGKSGDHEGDSLVAYPMSSAEGSGTKSEHGLSEGNSKGMRSNPCLDYTTQPMEHKLQHVDYGAITGTGE